MRKIDMVGMKFGRLTVKKETDRRGGKIAYLCECECGNITKVTGMSLRSGGTKSCGCLNVERVKEANTTHGMRSSKIYRIWSAMINRCTNPNDKNFKNYGGRGIKVCGEWLKFENFFADMGERPDGLTLERKNNELGYFKDNCCWATRCTQSQNQRLRSDSTTGVKGCCWHKQAKKYRVMISVNGKRHYIGYFKTLEAAKSARQEAELKYWGNHENL